MKNPFRSLPARIVTFVFGAILLTSLTVISLSIASIDSFLRDGIDQKYPVVLATKDVKLASWYRQREREIEVFSQSEVLLGNLPELSKRSQERYSKRAADEIEQYLLYVLDGFPLYTSLFILDSTGELMLSVGAPVDLTPDQRAALAAIHECSVGDAQTLSERQRQIVSTPLGDSDDETPHPTLHAVFDVTSLRSELSLRDAALQGYFYIVDRDRKVIVTSDADHGHILYKGALPTTTEMVVVSDYENPDGEKFVSGARGFERFGWTLVVEEPYGQALAPVFGAMRDVFMINLAIVLTVAIVTFRIAVSIIRPIEALSQAAHRISEGERDVEIPETNSRDEVGVLTRAFSAMTMRLTNNAAELEASHAAVEEANERLQLQNEELQRVNEVLEQLSITDGLTKLHNHRHFQEVMLRECKRADRSGRPLTLILIDIDHFKNWNDRLGHAGGDEILRRIADVLSELIRETDLLARYGGEEFALITPNTELEGAHQLAEKIRSTVASTVFLIDLPSERESVTVSVGVARYDGDRMRLFNDADRALYLAKESGRDCVMTVDDLG